jgi:hypothetical protein
MEQPGIAKESPLDGGDRIVSVRDTKASIYG